MTKEWNSNHVIADGHMRTERTIRLILRKLRHQLSVKTRDVQKRDVTDESFPVSGSHGFSQWHFPLRDEQQVLSHFTVMGEVNVSSDSWSLKKILDLFPEVYTISYHWWSCDALSSAMEHIWLDKNQPSTTWDEVKCHGLVNAWLEKEELYTCDDKWNNSSSGVPLYTIESSRKSVPSVKRVLPKYCSNNHR